MLVSILRKFYFISNYFLGEKISKLRMANTIIAPPIHPFSPRTSLAKIVEKRAAKTGSKLKRMAV